MNGTKGSVFLHDSDFSIGRFIEIQISVLFYHIDRPTLEYKENLSMLYFIWNAWLNFKNCPSKSWMYKYIEIASDWRC